MRKTGFRYLLFGEIYVQDWKDRRFLAILYHNFNNVTFDKSRKIKIAIYE
jgi:hypothetical protein